MIFKFALRNLIRFPWRTVLYGFVIFFIIMAMTASYFVWNACKQATVALDENYMFVASLVQRENTGILLQEVFKCLDYDKVTAFNVTMSEGYGAIPSGSTVTEMPSAKTSGSAEKVLLEEDACELRGVENLALVYPFFSGECTIREGTGFTQKGYMGETAEIVIPWYLAEQYALKVGDLINRRYYKEGFPGYIYIPTIIVGIYETSAYAPETKYYPAYIPLAVAELDYGKVCSSAKTDFKVERADFVLSGREEFARFVAYANDNGLDFKTANLIFNNSGYDVLSSELHNVHTIALLIFVLVLIVGFGVLIFFTVYLCHSRRKERMLLTSLGMKKTHIHGMLALELCLVILCAVLLGIGFGHLTANTVCHWINDTVLARASASETIRNIHSASEFEITMPLERNMKIQIFPDDMHIFQNHIELHEIKSLKENEIGVSRHEFHAMSKGGNYTAEELKIFENDNRPAVDIIGISDLSVLETTQTRDDLWEGAICLYVHEDSPFADERWLSLTETNTNDFVLNDLIKNEITNDAYCGSSRFPIAGTYQDNAYFSEYDIVVSLTDYHKLYASESITDAEHHFQRIGEIYPKPCE